MKSAVAVKQSLRAALIAGALVLTSLAAHAQTMQEQTLFLTFVPNIQFAPVYVALANGYWADAGVNITLEHGDEPLGVELIATGERQFGVISGEQVITARAQGRPVVSVYEWFQRYPVGIAYPTDSDIETVADLAGRTVGIPGRFGASYSGLIALLTANDMTEADIDLQEIGFNAPEVMCVGGVETAVVYINNEPLQIDNRAAVGDCGDLTGVSVFAVSDAVDMVSNGLITNEDTLTDDPELVRAMVAGFDHGVRDAIANPAGAYLASIEYVEGLPINDPFAAALTNASNVQTAWLAEHPDATDVERAARRAELLAALQTQFTPDALLQFQVLLNSIDLWTADRPGYADANSWEATQTVLETMGFVETPIDVAAAFNNDFLPEE